MVEINVMRTIPHIDLWFRRVKNKPFYITGREENRQTEPNISGI
jgi:hypothetical protein